MKKIKVEMNLQEAMMYCCMLTWISENYPNGLTQGTAADLESKIQKSILNQASFDEISEVTSKEK